MEHYHVNLGASHIPCSQVTRKRKHSIADIMKLYPNKANITVLFNTLLSPDCDNAGILKQEGQISFPIGLFTIKILKQEGLLVVMNGIQSPLFA